MAENKKTIVVYADWKDTFDVLSDDEAGKLIKHFFKYVNDLNPIAPDRITELSFIPIKNALKRDLDKWEKKLEDKSVNGRIGNLKRWNIDVFKRFEAKEITLEQAEIVAENRKTSHSDKSNRVATKPLHFIADSVSDNVSVSDNDITSTNVEVEKENFDDSDDLDSKIKSAFLQTKNQKEKKVAPKKESNMDFSNSLKFESPSWLDSVCIQQKKPPDKILEKIDEFTVFLGSVEKEHKSRKEFIDHFVNWVTKKFREDGNKQSFGSNTTKKQFRFNSDDAIKAIIGGSQ